MICGSEGDVHVWEYKCLLREDLSLGWYTMRIANNDIR